MIWTQIGNVIVGPEPLNAQGQQCVSVYINIKIKPGISHMHTHTTDYDVNMPSC